MSVYFSDAKVPNFTARKAHTVTGWLQLMCILITPLKWVAAQRKDNKIWNVRVNFKTIQILPLVPIIIIFKDACLVRFAHDPVK